VPLLHRCAIAVALLLPLLACTAPPATPRADRPERTDRGSDVAPTSESRTLVLATRVEVTSISHLPLWERRFTFLSTPRLFNATLAILDDRGLARPYLAESLPTLNTASWQVSPDGGMETTYRLRPALTWQDGAPLTAEDFVFTWRVLAAPDLGASNSQPQSLMETVSAPDVQTVVIRWRQPYPYADAMTELFQPLPRHLLEPIFEQRTPDSFASQSFWTRDYVNAGPYRVDRWEEGSFVEGQAFAGHALGRPKIDRIKLMFISDPNTVLSYLLAESVHVAFENSIRLQQAEILQREWAPRTGATVFLAPTLWRAVQMQQRPEYANPRSLTDVRVRKAIAHSMDRETLNGAVLEGHGVITEFMISPLMDYFAEVERATIKHPYDLRRAEQLMNDAGYAKGGDGFFASGSERFTTEVRGLTGAQQEQELAILGAGWRQFGLDIRESTIPAVQGQDSQLQATLPGLFAGGAASGERNLSNHTSTQVSRPENRWTGRNFIGWSNPEYDRLAEAFSRTLDRSERTQQIAEMARIFTTDSPSVTMYFSIEVLAHSGGLSGPKLVPAESAQTWDIHTWELRSPTQGG
jgi:peptide/nickel transport system substrate-binding protein